ncbi:ECF-type sigma factor [Gimesia sp.]|uniref:ECF-type sigma factor n=1 Tax=Gimesia sp. TaxID=2024833 RepID=UPI003A8E8F4C
MPNTEGAIFSIPISNQKSNMDKNEETPVSNWLATLGKDQKDVVQRIWDEFYEKLIRYAETRVKTFPTSTLDAEDIVLSVFESVWAASQQGRFDSVQNRDELWWLLIAMTHRKAVTHIRRETAQKRTSLHGKLPVSMNSIENFQAFVSTDRSPEYFVIMEEEYQRALKKLSDDNLKKIAVYKIQGYTHEEICELLDISPATVTRKVRLIRKVWSHE